MVGTLGGLIGAGDLFVGRNATVTNHFEANATLYVKDSQVGIGTDSPVSILNIHNGPTSLT